MARFGLWIAALSLVCLIALATSQNAPSDNSNDGDISATCTKYFDVDSKMCATSVVNMVFQKYLQYFEMMNPDHVREIMQLMDTDKDNFLNLLECQNFVQYIIKNAPNTPTTNTK